MEKYKNQQNFNLIQSQFDFCLKLIAIHVNQEYNSL